MVHDVLNVTISLWVSHQGSALSSGKVQGLLKFTAQCYGYAFPFWFVLCLFHSPSLYLQKDQDLWKMGCIIDISINNLACKI